MAQVVGIGGVFLTAEDPAALREWYGRVLGVEVQRWGGAVFAARPEGRSSWSVLRTGDPSLSPSARGTMINYVVDDLDGVLARVTEAGVEVLGRNDDDAFGRFAWIVDPAGMKLELWEPKRGRAAETG
jgi:predicted enzyme related to lactoylglutathione lyase